jgi:hypothetical protein
MLRTGVSLARMVRKVCPPPDDRLVGVIGIATEPAAREDAGENVPVEAMPWPFSPPMPNAKSTLVSCAPLVSGTTLLGKASLGKFRQQRSDVRGRRFARRCGRVRTAASLTISPVEVAVSAVSAVSADSAALWFVTVSVFRYCDNSAGPPPWIHSIARRWPWLAPR